MDKDDGKKEGLFKRLKNIEGKNEAQLKPIEDQGKKQIDAIKNINIGSKPLKTILFFSTLSENAKTLTDNIKQIDDWLDNAQLACTKTDGKTKYDFNKFTFLLKFNLKIYRDDLMLQETKHDKQELTILINKLNNNYNPKNETKIKEKDDTLKSAKNLLSVREEITRAFERGIFPYIDGFKVEKESDEESTLENEDIDTADTPDLGGEVSAAERRNQQGQGLKILTPNQMLSRLPISLVQLKAGNNCEKLKNEIRQLLYPLYRSNKTYKTTI